MKRGFLIVLLSAIVGGLTSYVVVRKTTECQSATLVAADAPQFRTVSLSTDNWPDFTYAAESAVDAVVYVKVKASASTQAMPNSIFDFFFGMPQGSPQPRD